MRVPLRGGIPVCVPMSVCPCTYACSHVCTRVQGCVHMQGASALRCPCPVGWCAHMRVWSCATRVPWCPCCAQALRVGVRWYTCAVSAPVPAVCHVGVTVPRCHCEDHPTLAWAPQRGCAVSDLGDFPDPAGPSHEQTGLSPRLILLGAGGQTRDPPGSPPVVWVHLWGTRVLCVVQGEARVPACCSPGHKAALSVSGKFPGPASFCCPWANLSGP